VFFYFYIGLIIFEGVLGTFLCPQQIQKQIQDLNIRMSYYCCGISLVNIAIFLFGEILAYIILAPTTKLAKYHDLLK
jgi:hypothetical protein